MSKTIAKRHTRHWEMPKPTQHRAKVGVKNINGQLDAVDILNIVGMRPSPEAVTRPGALSYAIDFFGGS